MSNGWDFPLCLHSIFLFKGRAHLKMCFQITFFYFKIYFISSWCVYLASSSCVLVGKMDVHIFSWLFLLSLFMCCYKQSKTQFSCSVQTWIRRAIKNWRLIINASKIWSCRKLWQRIINYWMLERMVLLKIICKISVHK